MLALNETMVSSKLKAVFGVGLSLLIIQVVAPSYSTMIQQGMLYRNSTIYLWLCYTRRGLPKTSWHRSSDNGMGYHSVVHHD